MKGFWTDTGYIGFLPNGMKMLFASESDYHEYISEEAEQSAQKETAAQRH